MENLWLKIKVWTKISVFTILTLFSLIFVFKNLNKDVKLWLWKDINTYLLTTLFITALISVLFTILLSTTFRTIRQFKEMRSTSRDVKHRQDVADMKAKVAMLQTKPPADAPITEFPPPPKP